MPLSVGKWQKIQIYFNFPKWMQLCLVWICIRSHHSSEMTPCPWNKILLTFNLLKNIISTDDISSFFHKTIRHIKIFIAFGQDSFNIERTWTNVCQLTDQIWWRHDMETLFASVMLCEMNAPITCGCPSHSTSNAKLWWFLCRLLQPWRSCWTHRVAGDLGRHYANVTSL